MYSVEILLTVISACLVIFLFYYKWAFQYWKKRNVPFLEPTIPFGNLTTAMKQQESIGMNVFRLYKEIRRNKWKHGGVFFFSRPTYVIVNLETVKNVFTRDFHHFVDRGFYYNEEDDPLSAHLLSVDGAKWKNLRTKLSPTFTIGKMKMMFQLMLECVQGLKERIEEESKTDVAIDIKEDLACFTTDVIGTCAFGLDCRSFKDKNSPFRIYTKKIFQMSPFDLIHGVFCFTFPSLARKLGFTDTPKDVAKFFMSVVKDTVTYRETNNVQRQDFLQLLINLKNNINRDEDGRKCDHHLTIEEIAAQCYMFFFAGFETSSTTLTFAFYELAKNPDIQTKTRDEIHKVLEKYGGELTYEALQEMKYVDQVIDETLRKYPPIPFISRICTLEYKIPEHNLILEKRNSILISVHGIHHDEEYYPDPEKFDPERFSEEGRNSRHRYAYLPFGEGPRMCIGNRFGLMQVKVGLICLLKDFSFVVDKKTQEPLEFKADSFIQAAVGEIWLRAQKTEEDKT